jgi:hypothetical protein
MADEFIDWASGLVATDVTMVAQCARRLGDVQTGRLYLRRALALERELGHRGHFPELLQEIAAVADSRHVAAQLLAVADRLARENDLPRWDPVDLARTIELACGDLGADFATAWEAGTRLTEDEALALAAGSLE